MTLDLANDDQNKKLDNQTETFESRTQEPGNQMENRETDLKLLKPDTELRPPNKIEDVKTLKRQPNFGWI